MAVNSTHPLYNAMLPQWERGRDCYEGEDAVKAKTDTYLTPTSGQRADGYGRHGTAGQAAYDTMLLRAYYPDIFKEAVEAAIGIMHRKPPTIKLPAKMADMEESCTLLGESIPMLLRRINATQLVTGRLGLLADLVVDDVTKVTRPVVVTYNDMSIINWNDRADAQDDVDVTLVVLNESGYTMGGDFEWVENTSYRVLSFIDKSTGLMDNNGVYGFALSDGSGNPASLTFTPVTYHGVPSEVIPFAFINSKDLATSPDRPPLDGLAKLCLTIYRGEADYRQNLFLQGQDTLVRVGHQTTSPQGAEEAVRVGAGAVIDVPVGGDAKYIGVSSQGLPEQRQSLENDYRRAVMKSGQLADAVSRAKESGDALRIRVAAQTATLPQVAQAGAAGLEKVLKAVAAWIGANPDDVSVEPNLEFTDEEFNGQALVQIMQAKALGAPISEASVHAYLSKKGLTELTYEDELGTIENEQPRI